MTYRQYILHILGSGHAHTCAYLPKEIGKRLDRQYYKEKDLNATVSSILKKMVDEKILKYGILKGPRGGSTYKIV